MKYVLDAHCHTIASGHAYSTLLEYVKAAKERGLSLLAVTDHAPAMPGACNGIYFSNFAAIPEKIDGVEIMMGVELNILNSNAEVDLDESLLQTLSPVIASFHGLCHEFSREGMSEEEKFVETTKTILKVMDNKHIQILGHPGDPRYLFDVEAVVKKSVETGTLLEMNNSSLDKTSFRYGSEDNMIELLRICKKYECPVVIGSDAHVANAVGSFEDVNRIMAEVNFPQRLVANTSIDKFRSLLKDKNCYHQ